jgi:hypothetical protein
MSAKNQETSVNSVLTKVLHYVFIINNENHYQ